ncbi:MAG: hypothetical protein JW923_04990 [Spirochaetales bacterium]|nr:hypothetical protein [Spirochaetales bacterium]
MFAQAVSRTALATMVLLALAVPVHTQDGSLRVISTEWFDIIYHEDTRACAEYLAGFADDTYRQVAGLLATKPKRRLPVYLSGASEDANGHYSSYPYPHIVLGLAAPDVNGQLGSFKDSLRSIFLHELTHHVSLGIRGPFQDAMVAVFGSPLALSPYTTPLSFVEGVTVSLESLDGHGRAADPLAAALIRQDILEGRFKSWEQAAGGWDLWPGALFYEYGGWFSRYLQERYGMEAYAELWKRLGTGMLAKPLDRGLFSDGHFMDVYGLTLDRAWDDFRDWMSIKEAVLMDVRTLSGISVIPALAVFNGTLYYADARKEAVCAMAAAGGPSRELFRLSRTVTRIDAEPDGKLLLSTVAVKSGQARLVLSAWDPAAGRLTDLPYRSLRDASRTPEGSILAIRVDGPRGDIVVTDGSGVNVVLKGSERVAYASPSFNPGDGLIYALAKIDGTTRVLRVAPDGSQPELLELPDALSHLRYLSLDDAVLRAAWDDRSLYRLLEVDLASGLATWQTVPQSGGVHWPVGSDGGLWYIGNFSDGNAVCTYPPERATLGFAAAQVAWEDASGTLPGDSVYDSPASLDTKPYSSLPWLQPRHWLPYASLDGLDLAELGASLYLAEPTESFSAVLAGAWDLEARAVDAAITLSWFLDGWDLTLYASDDFLPPKTTAPVAPGLRASAAGIRGSGTAAGRTSGALSWSVAAELAAAAEFAAGPSPYVAWTDTGMMAVLGLGWSDTRRPAAQAPLAGWTLDAVGKLIFPLGSGWEAPAYSGEASVLLMAWGLGLRVDAAVCGPGALYGAYGLQTEGLWFRAFYPVYPELSNLPSGPWYAQAELSARLLGAEVQKGGLAYINRLALRAGARANGLYAATAGVDDAWESVSLFGRLELTLTPVAGAFARLHPLVALEFWGLPFTGRLGFGIMGTFDAPTQP